MTRLPPLPPPDDDPAFHRWLAEVELATEDFPEDVRLIHDRRALLAGLATCAAIAGMAVSITVAWLVMFDVMEPITALLWAVGGVILAGISLIFLVWRAS